MSTWTSVRDHIHRFIQWTHADPRVRAAAKIALESIPVVGGPLSAIYEEVSAAGRADETAAATLLEVLAKIEDIGPSGLDEVRGELEAIAASQGDALSKLGAASTRVDRLRKEIRAARAQLRDVTETLARVEADLEAVTWGSMDYAADSAADRVTFLLQLSGLLRRSQTIFGRQLEFARELLTTIELPRDVKDRLLGMDDRLWWASLNERFETGSSWRMFGELRRITRHMREVNLRTRWLVRSHRDLLPLDFPTAALEAHLSLWLAKYEYLARTQADTFCLVFVGVEPTGVPFPEGVDEAIASALERALAEARLDHLAVGSEGSPR